MSVEPYDEEEIVDDDVIVRRVDPEQHVIWDSNTNRNRISSKLYSKSSGVNGGMSVDIERLIIHAGIEPAKFVTTPKHVGSVWFTAQDVRAFDLMVGYDPIENVAGLQDNPFHGEVWTRRPSRRFSNQQRRGLAGAAEWYVQLDETDLR
ncbi:MAG: hypothetical protein AAGI88_02485 [Pseudomonadota bacterium]